MKKLKKCQNGGKIPLKDFMGRKTTFPSIDRNIKKPILSTIKESEDGSMVLNRDKIVKLTNNPNLPYSFNDLVDIEYADKLRQDKYADDYEKIKSTITIKDKNKIRNNQKVNTAILDDIVKASIKNNIDPYLALAIAQRESGIGHFSATDTEIAPNGDIVSNKGYTKRPTRPDDIFSNWTKQDKGLNAEELKKIYGDISPRIYNKVKNYFSQIDDYPFQGEMKTINDKTKNGTFIRGYNYGDPDYPNKVNKEKKILLSPENYKFQNYVDSVAKISLKKKGGAITNTGYLKDSPDRFNDYNIIPSNQITMQDVPHPIFGVDDLGNQQIMYPGQEYNFPGNYVTEYPIKKQNGGIISARDNTKVVIPKISKTSVNNDLLDSYEEVYGANKRSALEKQIIKYGDPKINYNTKGWFGGNASYNPFNNTINSGLYEIKNSEDYDFFGDKVVQELAHAKQMQDKGILGLAGQWLTNDVPDYINRNLEKNNRKNLKNKIKNKEISYDDFLNELESQKYTNPYKSKGNLEYEAHSIIAPQIANDIKNDISNKIYNKSILDKIKNESMKEMKKGGGIHIKESHKGLFTAKADAAGMGVQEYASHVLANKDNFPASTVKQANFAKNASKFKHQLGGQPEDLYGENITPFYNYDPGYNIDSVDSRISTKPDINKLSIKDYLKAQDTNQILNRASSNLMNQFVNPGSLYNLAGYAEGAVNLFSNKNKQQEEYLAGLTNTDALYNPIQGGDRGDYVVNGSAYGQFQPDQMGAKSPYGMYGKRFYQTGGVIGRKPVSKVDTLYTPKGNMVLSTDLAELRKNNLPFNSMKEYGEWLDLWSTPQTNINNNPSSSVVIPNSSNSRIQPYQYDSPDYFNTAARRKPAIVVPSPVYNGIPIAKKEYGGQNGFSLDLRNSIGVNSKDPRVNPLKKTLAPVDRDEANIEAEKGETIFGDFDNDGFNEHMEVGGKRHSQGGTPVQAPAASFVFSDTKSMNIGGDILQDFGKPEGTKKKYTPADLAKQYDINKYKVMLEDPNLDPIKARTAEIMIDNYNKKLGKLALVQEEKKGFPSGIPEVALPYLMTQMGPDIEVQDNDMGQNYFAVGGTVDPLDINPYKGGKTTKGTVTPTGKKNPYNRDKQYLQQWESLIPGITKLNNSQAQSLIYDYTLKNNPSSVTDMWSQYGNTAKGLRTPSTRGIGKDGRFNPSDLTPDNLGRLKDAYVDGYFGARQLDPTATVNTNELGPLPTPPRLDNPIIPVKPKFPNDPESELQPNSFNPKSGSQAPTDFWTQDKLNTFAALSNRAGIKKYMPWMAPINGVTPDPTFYDPTRELAANAEMANTEMMYNNQFSNAQAASARNSAVSANSVTNVANTIGKYNNLNVGLSNEFANIDAQMNNQLIQANANRANQLYQGNVIANQQYDNSRSQANEVIRRNVIGALDNRQKTQWINSWYPQYDLDPGSGYINFASGTGYSGVNGARTSSASTTGYLDTYKQLKRENPDVPDEVLREQAKQMTGQARNTVTSDGDVRSTSTGPSPQYMQQILQSFGGR